MLLSVILPTHNTQEILRTAIESITRSTSRAFEVIIVDDFSAEPAQDVVSSFDDSRLRCLRNDANLGPGLSRNKGLAYARGDFITFMDADDWYCDFALDYLVHYLKNVEADFFVFDFCIVLADGIKKVRWEPSEQTTLIDFLQDRIISTVWNKVYRKSIIASHNIKFPGFLCEDSVFNCHYLVYCEKIFHIDKILYNYDKRGESLSKKKFDAEQMHELTKATEVVGRIICAHTGTRDWRKVMTAYERRQFLFLFRIPLLRFYEDWKIWRVDIVHLETFRKNLPISPIFILGGLVVQRVSFLEAGVYIIFRASPSLAFRIMKTTGL